jgi:hypothetical protein
VDKKEEKEEKSEEKDKENTHFISLDISLS